MTWIDWYNDLHKPSWTPEPATIGLIWQTLYGGMLEQECNALFLAASRNRIH